jgi:hypothetical protein
MLHFQEKITIIYKKIESINNLKQNFAIKFFLIFFQPYASPPLPAGQ